MKLFYYFTFFSKTNMPTRWYLVRQRQNILFKRGFHHDAIKFTKKKEEKKSKSQNLFSPELVINITHLTTQHLQENRHFNIWHSYLQFYM